MMVSDAAGRYDLVAALLMSLCIVGFGGCAMPGTIKADAYSYEDVVEDTTDKFLVANVLRARDRAPQHFVDIPQIRESIQSTASIAATVPFGARNGSSARNSAGTTLGVQATPSFELTHINSKDFVTGIASTIEPKFIKYWLDRGLDTRIVLLLFVSSAEIVQGTNGHQQVIRVLNSPRESVDAVEQAERGIAPRDDCQASDFSRFLTIVNRLPDLRAKAYVEQTQIGAEFELDLSKGFKDVAGLDFAKVALEPASRSNPRMFKLYSVSPPKIALCYDGAQRLAEISGPGASTKAEICRRNVVRVSSSPASPTYAEDSISYAGEKETYCAIFKRFTDSLNSKNPRDPALSLRLSLRSVGEMIQYLGDLVAYQEELDRFRVQHGPLKGHNNPVTLGYCHPPEAAESPDRTKRQCTNGGTLFDVHAEPERSRLVLSYRGERYAVGAYSPQDHSLEVLSVLHQLIDLNKSSSDLRSTPLVQVLQ